MWREGIDVTCDAVDSAPVISDGVKENSAMARIEDLAEVLAPIVGLRCDTVGRHVRHLRNVGLISDEGARLNSRDAATLLIGVMAGRSPTESVAAVRIVGGLPL